MFVAVVRFGFDFHVGGTKFLCSHKGKILIYGVAPSNYQKYLIQYQKEEKKKNDKYKLSLVR